MPLDFGPIGDADASHEHDAHGDGDGASLPEIEHRAPESEDGREGNDEQRPNLQHVGDGVGVLIRMRSIGVEEAAAIGAEFLDRLLARNRTDGNDLLGALERRRFE